MMIEIMVGRFSQVERRRFWHILDIGCWARYRVLDLASTRWKVGQSRRDFQRVVKRRVCRRESRRIGRLRKRRRQRIIFGVGQSLDTRRDAIEAPQNVKSAAQQRQRPHDHHKNPERDRRAKRIAVVHNVLISKCFASRCFTSSTRCCDLAALFDSQARGANQAFGIEA